MGAVMGGESSCTAGDGCKNCIDPLHFENGDAVNDLSNAHLDLLHAKCETAAFTIDSSVELEC